MTTSPFISYIIIPYMEHSKNSTRNQGGHVIWLCGFLLHPGRLKNCNRAQSTKCTSFKRLKWFPDPLAGLGWTWGSGSMILAVDCWTDCSTLVSQCSPHTTQYLKTSYHLERGRSPHFEWILDRNASHSFHLLESLSAEECSSGRGNLACVFSESHSSSLSPVSEAASWFVVVQLCPHGWWGMVAAGVKTPTSCKEN